MYNYFAWWRAWAIASHMYMNHVMRRPKRPVENLKRHHPSAITSQTMVRKNARHAWTLRNCNRTFSIRSSRTKLKGHLKDDVYFLDDHKQRFSPHLDGCLTNAWTHATRLKRLLKSVCIWIVNAGLPFFFSGQQILQESCGSVWPEAHSSVSKDTDTINLRYEKRNGIRNER